MSQLERFSLGDVPPDTPFGKTIELTFDKLVTALRAVLNKGIRFEDNFDSYIAVITTNATPGVETAIAHGLKRVPLGCRVLEQTAPGHLYRGPSGKDATNYYVASDVSSLTARIMIF